MKWQWANTRLRETCIFIIFNYRKITREKETSSHSSTLAWKNSMDRGAPVELQSMRLQRVRHNWATEHNLEMIQWKGKDRYSWSRWIAVSSKRGDRDRRIGVWDYMKRLAFEESRDTSLFVIRVKADSRWRDTGGAADLLEGF